MIHTNHTFTQKCVLIIKMPCESSPKDISVGGVSGHGHVSYIVAHEPVVKVLVMREEPESDGAYVETGVRGHPGVVADSSLLLRSEHAGSRAEDGRVVFREITQVHAYLCVHRMPEPAAVVVEPVLQDEQRHRHYDIVGGMLYDGFVLEVDPGSGEVESNLTGDDLHVPHELLGTPICRRDIDGLCDVLEAEIDAGFDPFGGVRDGSASEEAVCEREVIVPSNMVRVVVVEVGAGFDALGVGACADGKGVFACVELGVNLAVHIELAELITEHAHLAFDGVQDVLAAMLMNGAADEGVVLPSVVVYAVVGNGVVQEPLALVHGEGGYTELEGAVVRFAERDGDCVPDREDIGGVVGPEAVAVDIIVEALIGCFFDVSSVGVIGLEDVRERDKGYVFHFDGVPFDALSVFDDLDGVYVLALFGDGVLVMEVAAEVAVARHGVESRRKVFGCHLAMQVSRVFESAVVEGAESAPTEGGVHGVMCAGVAAPNGAAKQFAGGVGVVPDGVEVLHVDAEVEFFADVAGEEKTKVVLFVSGGEAFLVGNGGVGCGGVEVTLLLGRDDIRGHAPGKGVVDGERTVLDDA